MMEGHAPTLKKNERFEGSIDVAEDLRRGAEVIRDGGVLVADNGCVYAQTFDGRNPSAVKAAFAAKGRDLKQTFSLAGPTQWFIDMVDIDAVAPKFQSLLRDPKKLQLRTSGLLFVRAPLKPEAAKKLPEAFRSYDTKSGLYYGQNWDPVGRRYFYRLMEATNECLAEVGKDFLPGITSHNKSKQPEVVDRQMALQLAKQMGLSILVDGHARRNGTSSYPIIAFTPAGLEITRGGSIDDTYIRELFRGYPMKRAANYKQANHSPLLADAIISDEKIPVDHIRELSLSQLKELLLWIMQ